MKYNLSLTYCTSIRYAQQGLDLSESITNAPTNTPADKESEKSSGDVSELEARLENLRRWSNKYYTFILKI